MSHGKEPSFRKRLIEAREDIIAQLANLNFRSIPGGRGFGGPPDYRSPNALKSRSAINAAKSPPAITSAPSGKGPIQT